MCSCCGHLLRWMNDISSVCTSERSSDGMQHEKEQSGNDHCGGNTKGTVSKQPQALRSACFTAKIRCHSSASHLSTFQSSGQRSGIVTSERLTGRSGIAPCLTSAQFMTITRSKNLKESKQIARPLAFGRVRSLKLSLFPF